MKIWFLVVYSMSIYYSSTTQHQFYTKEACERARAVIESSAASAPKVAVNLRTECIEDQKPSNN